jgi:hypothetical protein
VLRSGSGAEAGHQRGGAGAKVAVSRGSSLHGRRREATQTSRGGEAARELASQSPGAVDGSGGGGTAPRRCPGGERGERGRKDATRQRVSSSGSCVGFVGQKLWDVDGLQVGGHGPIFKP